MIVGSNRSSPFNVLRVNWPEISVERRVWDKARQIFAEGAARTFRHTDEGWIEAS